LRFDSPPPAEFFTGEPEGGGPPPSGTPVGGSRPRSGNGGQFAEVHEREPEMAEAGQGFPGMAPPPSTTRANRRRTNGGTPRGGTQPADPRAPWAGTGRNAQCPCGSGKKFKHCHGRI